MMNTAPLFIAHRINTIAELRTIPEHCGVEIDLRDSEGQLILNHDPFGTGERFEEYLKGYRHRTLIVNIKSERIELKARALLKEHSITDYFFLDSSFPMVHALAGTGEKNIAIRFSEFEGLDTVMAMQGRVSWVWADCFTRLPFTAAQYVEMKGYGYKVCLVSPELQGRPEDVPVYRDALKKMNIIPDAICCKIAMVPVWKDGLS